MAINFSKPENTDSATGVLAQLRENISSILTQTHGSGTNIPTASFRKNPTSGVSEYYNGSVWSRVHIASSASGGSANAQTITVASGITAYQDGQEFFFPTGFTNTGSCTLNVNSIGATTIYDSKTGAALVGLEIIASSVAHVVYYNSLFYLLNANPASGTWTPTYTGFSADPTTLICRYSKIGKFCTVYYRATPHGTSNATGFTITAPFTAATVANALWGVSGLSIYNNGTLAYTGNAYILSAGTTITIERDSAGTAWTNSGTKGVNNFQFTYQVA